MVKQLYIVGKVYNVTNIYNFIKLLSEEVEDLTEDFIKYIAELYIGPDRDAETDKDKSK